MRRNSINFKDYQLSVNNLCYKMEKLSRALVSLLLTVILTDFSESALVQQRFIEEPRSVSIEEGQDVVLSCRVDNKMGVLQWTKGLSSCISDKMTQNGNKISHSSNRFLGLAVWI